jgi:hypothetical protein
MRLFVPGILLMLFCNNVCSQVNTNAVSNAGGGSSVLSPDFIVDWSIGETTVIDTYGSAHSFSTLIPTNYLYVTCGVLQPFDNTRLFYGGLSKLS